MSALVDGGRSGDCIQIRNTFISISIRNTLTRLVSPDSVVCVCVCARARLCGVTAVGGAETFSVGKGQLGQGGSSLRLGRGGAAGRPGGGE